MVVVVVVGVGERKKESERVKVRESKLSEEGVVICDLLVRNAVACVKIGGRRRSALIWHETTQGEAFRSECRSRE